MPQFDPSLYVVQFVWLAIFFVALYVLMAMVALPRIGAVLEERQRRIDDNLDRAQKMKIEAEEAARQYEQTLDKARLQAAEIYNEGAGKLAAESEARQKELAGRLEEMVRTGEARIAEAREQAMSDVKAIAKDAARDIVLKLTGIEADGRAINAAVTAAVKERN